MHTCTHSSDTDSILFTFYHPQALDPAQDVLVAFEQNHERLLPDHGFPVRLIIPGPIDTDIWDRPGNNVAHYDGPREPPETVARGIVAAIGSDTFEHYLPDLKGVVEFKTSDIDTFLAAASEL